MPKVATTTFYAKSAYVHAFFVKMDVSDSDGGLAVRKPATTGADEGDVRVRVARGWLKSAGKVYIPRQGL